MVAASHGERLPLHVVLSTSPVALNWCSTQHAGMGVGTGEGGVVGTGVGTRVGLVVGWNVGVGADVGTDVGTRVGLRENAVGVGSAVGKAVGTGVGPFVGAAVGVLDGLKIEGAAEGWAVGVFVGVFVGGNVGRFVGTGVGAAVGTVVSSSRRAPSRRPLDRRAFGPLRGGCCCPHANALSSTHRPRRSMLRALLSQLVCPDALLCTPRRWLISVQGLAASRQAAESPVRAAPDRRDRSRSRPRGPGAAGRQAKSGG